MAALRRIVYASDFSRASNRAFAVAIDFARQHKAALTIVHVLMPILPGGPDVPISAVALAELQRGTRTWAERQGQRLVARAAAAGVRAVATVVEGNPAAEIVRSARRARAGLIVIGTHGRTGLPRLVLGSVADRVVRTATMPVLTVRGR